MGMDRNTVTGFVLIGILLIGMFYFNSKNRLAYEGEKLRIEDSLKALQPKIDTVTARIDSLEAQILKVNPAVSVFQNANVEAKDISLENEVMKITFSAKGGQPKKVELKNFKKYDSTQVVLLEGAFNEFYYSINAANNSTVKTSDIIFNAEPVKRNADNSQTLVFFTGDSSGKKIVHQYNLKPKEYMVDLSIQLENSDKLFTNNIMGIHWQNETPQVEKDHKYENTQTHISYLENNNFDFEYAGEGDNLKLKEPTKWVGLKQQFFINGLIAKNNFSSASIEWKVPADTNMHYIAQTVTNAKIDLPAGSNVQVPLQFYYGPSDYKILKNYNLQLEDMVPYGSGVFSFVKYINRHFLLPVFDFLQKYFASMGIVILLLTLLIRLITSPILYKSYLSGAKMKVLKPEVDALKLKFTDPKTNTLDQQAFSMEQMKLWRSAGVSPLGGCLPALLQVPIFMSLYYFFQSNIDLRGKTFLWATDLATYDTIAKLPFSIPFYGDHVSLFTITATITSLLISIYSMNNMQDNSNPVMKYMPYIFPIFLLGIFNNLPSALTWYYTVSNIITLILQIIIQKYIINHDSILAQISEKRKQPVKQSKFAGKIAAMQEAQKKIQDQKKAINQRKNN